MSVYSYDSAIIQDLRTIFNDPRIHIVPEENLFRLVARAREDEVKLPMISLWRTGWSVDPFRSHPQKFDGKTVAYEEDSHKLYNLQVLRLGITYQLDIWTKTREENDDILAEIIFYYETHPTLTVRIDNSLNLEHTFNLRVDSDVQDNSDVAQHLNRGEYFRQSIGLYTDDAYLWKSSSRFKTVVDPTYKSNFEEKEDVLDVTNI